MTNDELLELFAQRHYNQGGPISHDDDFPADYRNLLDLVAALSYPTNVVVILNDTVIALNLWGKASANHLLFGLTARSGWPVLKSALVAVGGLESAYLNIPADMSFAVAIGQLTQHAQYRPDERH